MLENLRNKLSKTIFDELLNKDNLSKEELAFIVMHKHDSRDENVVIPRHIFAQIAEALTNDKQDYLFTRKVVLTKDNSLYDMHFNCCWPPKTWQEKLVEEYKDVVLKETKLFKFMSPCNPDWAKLSRANKSALTEQNVILNKYKNILILRAALNGIELPDERKILNDKV